MRRAMVAIGILALAVVLVRPPSADIRIMAHDAGDPSPRRIEAAVDLGLIALSVIVTWTQARLTYR